ncbi:MAG: hypothetical protein M4579_003819 [Chaenotheca gracillima]|nr:MAG: hypothetical protein M4579_003819 [Chaenotheca gracillima]
MLRSNKSNTCSSKLSSKDSETRRPSVDLSTTRSLVSSSSSLTNDQTSTFLDLDPGILSTENDEREESGTPDVAAPGGDVFGTGAMFAETFGGAFGTFKDERLAVVDRARLYARRDGKHVLVAAQNRTPPGLFSPVSSKPTPLETDLEWKSPRADPQHPPVFTLQLRSTSKKRSDATSGVSRLQNEQ